MQKKSLCIIHIGLHHTATTSFQNFLKINSKKLKDFSIIYPETGIHANQHSLFPGCFLPNHISLPENRSLELKFYLEKLSSELKRSKCEICFLSSEVFTELINTSLEDINLLIEALSKYFQDLKIFITTRDPTERALSQLKAMLRRSNINTKFRKEIFNAHKYFPRKLLQPEISINKWKVIKKEIIIFKKKNNSNAVKDYFEFLLEIIKESRLIELQVKNNIKNNNEYNIYQNRDSFPSVMYLLLMLVGKELFKKDDLLEEKLDFEFIKNYFENLCEDRKKALNEVTNLDILNYLNLKNTNNSKENNTSINAYDLIRTYKFSYSIAFLIEKCTREIIDELIDKAYILN